MIDLGKRKLILGSASPRRKSLLEGLNVPFEVRALETEEDYPDNLPVDQIAAYLAKKKAEAFLGHLQENEIVLTADTCVIVDDMELGKPANQIEALGMLSLLSGRVHEVHTAVTLASREKLITLNDRVLVHFNDLSYAEMLHYIKNYMPLDKAGAYGIQEWIGFIGVEKIEGSFYTVMGLPLHLVYKLLKEF